MPKSNTISNGKNMSKDRSLSFVCEIPLRATQTNTRILNARFEAAGQMYNALLGEGMRRQSKKYNQAQAIKEIGQGL